MGKLTDYILKYDECNFTDYYERNIKTMGGKYTRYPLGFGQEAICPLHDDHDPSLGILKSRKSGSVVFKCFGCGRTGTIVDFHRAVRSKYDGVKLDEKSAVLELCKMYNIPEPELKDLASEDYEKKFELRMKALDNWNEAYSRRDFADALLKMRKTGSINIDAVGNECIKLIASEKGLVN